MSEEQWNNPDATRDDGFGDEIQDESLAGEKTNVSLSLDGYTFDTLVGFDDEIARLRELGVVDEVDEEYLAFVEQMKSQHGLYNEPTGDVIVFRAAVREDADRLMIATANELGRPTIRMRVVDGPMGARALCVMATPGIDANGFDEWGTLVLEGIDSWGAADAGDYAPTAASLQESAGSAMKALALIRSSLANPKVAVFASISDAIVPNSPLSALLSPSTLFDIPAPGEDERDAIWDHLMDKHVSMSALDRFELVKLTKGMPRCDIFAAAKEAVSQAYRLSLERFSYVPVSRANLLDKIAAYQPLDSVEYQQIEDSVVEDFKLEIERLERGES